MAASSGHTVQDLNVTLYVKNNWRVNGGLEMSLIKSPFYANGLHHLTHHVDIFTFTQGTTIMLNILKAESKFKTSEVPQLEFPAGHRLCFGFSCSRDTRWRRWLRHCATRRKVAGSIPDSVTGIFHRHKSSRPPDGPGVDSVSNRNDYQEYFLGGVQAASA
jgi:hypothetical protein